MKSNLAKKARILRQAGRSIKTIARDLEVSPSSVSRWCKDVQLTPAQKKSLESKSADAGRNALIPWIEKNKEQKKVDIAFQTEAGIKDIGKLFKRDLFFLGIGLYWGEGYKKGSQELGFTNSDPELICTFLEWLKDAYDVPRHRLIARLTINKRYAAEAEKIQREWIAITGISKEQFTKPSFISSTKEFVNKGIETYKGTLRIKVRRGTSLRRRILASIKESSNQISRNSRKTFS